MDVPFYLNYTISLTFTNLASTDFDYFGGVPVGGWVGWMTVGGGAVGMVG